MNRYDGIDNDLVRNVKLYARYLKKFLPFFDLDDIEQELMCFALECLRKFNKRNGCFNHFLRKVLFRRAVTLIQKSYCAKRKVSLVSIDNVNRFADTKRDLSFHSEDLIDIQKATNCLPHKYRLFFHFLMQDDLHKLGEILHCSRFELRRDFHLLVRSLQSFLRSENKVLFIDNLKGSLRMKNISVIETMNTKELSSLEVFELADLSDQVSKLLSHAKELKEKLDDALNLRFSEAVKENLRLENKDTGTTKFTESGFQIVAEVPKKVTWDAQKMEEIIKTIPESHRRDYIKTTYSIDERRYANFSYEYQQLFKPARTVTPGKTKFQIKLPEEV